MTDAITRLIEMRDELDAMIEAEERKAEKLRMEQLETRVKELETLVEHAGMTCANALALMSKAKFHTDHAAQVSSVKRGLMQVARVA